jgi:hypothetical protein
MTDQPTGLAAPAAPAALSNPWWRPPMRDVLAILSSLIFVGAFAATFAAVLAGVKLDPGAAQGLGQFQGAAITQWVGVMGWYFGSAKPAGAA